MAIKVDDLLKGMLEAAKASFDNDWPKVKELAETELKGVAEGILLIEKLRGQDNITQKQAKLLIRMKESNAKIILLTLEGMSLIVVEKAINASIKSVKDTVNNSLNFALL